MVETRSSRNRRNTCVWVSWSDVNHDVLFLVMMKLGVIDFLSFGGVCKSWRSFALANRKMFMASRPPMPLMWITSTGWEEKEKKKNEIECCLKDFDGRMPKTVIRHPARPRAAGKWGFVGLTRGYLVLFMFKYYMHHVWLVNPITRHQLHFPAFPDYLPFDYTKAIIVFSPSMSGWVLVVIEWVGRKIWFSVADQGAWTCVSCEDDILDIHVFKGKIYTLNSGGCLYELRLNLNPSLSKLGFTDFWVQHIYRGELISLGENLYVINTGDRPRILYKVDFGQMKMVSPEEEKTIGEYVILLSDYMHGVAIKPESCVVDPRSIIYKEAYDCFHASTDETQKGRFFTAHRWYFPHLCLDVDILDES